MRKGWQGEPQRHSICRRGIITSSYHPKNIISNGISNYSYTVLDNPYIDYKMNQWHYEDAVLKDMEWEKSMDDTEEHSVEDYVYHTTDLKNLESIIKNGLITNKDKLWEVSQEANYVSEYPAYSVMWYVRNLQSSGKLNYKQQYGHEKFIVLRVPHKYLNLEDDDTSMTGYYGNSFFTTDNIQPKIIEIKTNNGWIPIKNIGSD